MRAANTYVTCHGRDAISLGHHHFKETTRQSCNGSGVDVQIHLPCAPCHGWGYF